MKTPRVRPRGPHGWAVATVAVAIAMTAAACGPSMPDASGARAAFTARRAAIESLEEGLRRTLTAVPHLGESIAGFPCPDETPCPAERRTAIRERNVAIQGLEEQLETLASSAGALAARVEVTTPDDDLSGTLASTGPAPPGRKRGSIEATESGVEVDGRDLGWGLYQTAHGDEGDGAYHPGIQVISTLAIGRAEARLHTFFLLD